MSGFRADLSRPFFKGTRNWADMFSNVSACCDLIQSCVVIVLVLVILLIYLTLSFNCASSIHFKPSDPETGRVQMEPPSYTQGVNGPTNDSSRPFTPTNGGPLSGTTSQAPASPPSVQAAAGGAARPGKRQYAVNQTAAYGYDQAAAAAGPGPGGGSMGQPGYPMQPGQLDGQAQGGPGQFFSPALGDPNQQQNQYYAGQQQGPGPSIHGRQYSQSYGQAGQAPAYGQQQPQQAGYGQQQQPGVQGLTNQFSGMGIQQRLIQTANLIGYNLDPRGMHEPPPEIRLPPGVSKTQETLLTYYFDLLICSLAGLFL